MKIIIEGCDGTGKTTLARLLAKKYDLDICHCTQNDPCDFEFYKQTARKENVIWDRHTIGELIYPNVFNRKAQITPEDARIVLGYAKENNGKIFVLTADDEVIRERLLLRHISEDSRILDKLSYINDQFKYFANMLCVPIIDTSKLTVEEIFKMVETENNFKFIHK